MKKAKSIAEEAERKYEEIHRKLTVTEADLERAEIKSDDVSAKYKSAEAEIFRLTEGKTKPPVHLTGLILSLFRTALI